VILFWQHDWAN